MHLRTKVPDCERFEVGVGVFDDEVANFLFRIIKACIENRQKMTEVDLIYLLVDDFDISLMIAAAYGYANEAL